MGNAQPNLILPPGTRVVSRHEVVRDGELICGAGAVGVVLESPTDATHAYRVQLPSGAVVALHRGEFRILRAYGLEVGDSDTDLRGVYLAPAELHWSLFGVPEKPETRAALNDLLHRLRS